MTKRVQFIRSFDYFSMHCLCHFSLQAVWEDATEGTGKAEIRNSKLPAVGEACKIIIRLSPRLTECQSISCCFKPSQPERVRSGLKETFIKRYIVERTNKAEMRPEQQSEKAESCRDNLWNEIQLKGP